MNGSGLESAHFSWDEAGSGAPLQPYLLDRLTRDPRDADADTARTTEQFKRCLLRDLSWLLNAKQPPEAAWLEDVYPLLASSSMNYGIPLLSGASVAVLTSERRHALESVVRTAINRFEPRIRSRGLRVSVLEPGSLDSTEAAGTCVIEMLIEGDALALPERLVLQTKLNVATGLCEEVWEKSNAALGR